MYKLKEKGGKLVLLNGLKGSQDCSKLKPH